VKNHRKPRLGTRYVVYRVAGYPLEADKTSLSVVNIPMQCGDCWLTHCS